MRESKRIVHHIDMTRCSQNCHEIRYEEIFATRNVVVGITIFEMQPGLLLRVH